MGWRQEGGKRKTRAGSGAGWLREYWLAELCRESPGGRGPGEKPGEGDARLVISPTLKLPEMVPPESLAWSVWRTYPTADSGCHHCPAWVAPSLFCSSPDRFLLSVLRSTVTLNAISVPRTGPGHEVILKLLPRHGLVNSRRHYGKRFLLAACNSYTFLCTGDI
jgi:hypothetical protein